MKAAGRLIVRRARAGDLDAIVAMRVALLGESRGNPAHRRLRRDFAQRAPTLFAHQLADARCLTLVAYSGRACIGVLRCALSAPNPLYSPSRHAYLMSAYVRPAHRHRGVLRALLRHADVWCARHGVSEMRLHCGIDNDGGNAAWQALDFEPAELLYVRGISSSAR